MTVHSFAVAAVGLVLNVTSALAGSAAWRSVPVSAEWNDAANWTPGGPPNGSADTATFELSSVTAVSVSASTKVDRIVFSTVSVPYTISASANGILTFAGLGISNNSPFTQYFVAEGNGGKITFTLNAMTGAKTAFMSNGGSTSGPPAGVIEFRSNATAGEANFTSRAGVSSGGFGGVAQFLDNASAAHGTFTNEGRTIRDAGSGVTFFYDNASAADGTFVNQGGKVPGGVGGGTVFFNNSTAGHGVFSHPGGTQPFAGGGITQFYDTANAGAGTFTLDGGAVSGGDAALLQFFDFSTGAHAMVHAKGGPTNGAAGATIKFEGHASAGESLFVVDGAVVDYAGYGSSVFRDNSTAASAVFIINHGAYAGALGGGLTEFLDSSTAANANFTINGAVNSTGSGGGLLFLNDSSATNATVVVNGSPFKHRVCTDPICGVEYPGTAGGLGFGGTATAARARLIAHGDRDGGDGGLIFFTDYSSGGTAWIEINGNSRLDIGTHRPPGVTIGSLEGQGVVFLGPNTLTVGSNNLSTTFSGVMRDGYISFESGPTEGSLRKIGAETLVLFGANTYTGGTSVNEGTLEINGSVISAVTVSYPGTLAGSGFTQNVVVNEGGRVAPGGFRTLHINGNHTQNSGAILRLDVAGAQPDAIDHLEIAGNAMLDGRLEVRFRNGFLPTTGQTFKLFHVAGAVSGMFAQVIFPNLKPGFHFRAEIVNGTYQITALNNGIAANGFLNLSTRAGVGSGDNALIGGFTITGAASKKVILRAIGPSLAVGGTPLPGRLVNPALELRDSAGGLVASNDDWINSPQKQEIIDSTIAPIEEHEAAIIATLAPGSYTAIMRGVNNTTGIGVVEAYDLDDGVPTSLVNISSRGFVGRGNDVMIGGFIVDTQASHIILRAIGPSLSDFGIPNSLADPTLELHDSYGNALAFNDDWQDTDAAAIEGTGIPPANAKESAIVATLVPGPYTAVVRGRTELGGVALVEVYRIE